jgi:hypothetical protein
MVFLDRDPTHFAEVLHYLRSGGQLHYLLSGGQWSPISPPPALRRELQFYHLAKALELYFPGVVRLDHWPDGGVMIDGNTYTVQPYKEFSPAKADGSMGDPVI